MTEKQIDKDIALINQFLHECGEPVLINKTTQDDATIFGIIANAIEFSGPLIRSNMDRYMILNEAIDRTREHFSNLDTKPMVFSQPSNITTLRELSKQSQVQNHESLITHSHERPSSPKHH